MTSILPLVHLLNIVVYHPLYYFQTYLSFEKENSIPPISGFQSHNLVLFTLKTNLNDVMYSEYEVIYKLVNYQLGI